MMLPIWVNNQSETKLTVPQRSNLIKRNFFMNRDVSRCNQLNETILQNASRVSAAIKLTKEDSQTIAILRAEVDKAWKLTEWARDKEMQASKIKLSISVSKFHSIPLILSSNKLLIYRKDHF